MIPPTHEWPQKQSLLYTRPSAETEFGFPFVMCNQLHFTPILRHCQRSDWTEFDSKNKIYKLAAFCARILTATVRFWCSYRRLNLSINVKTRPVLRDKVILAAVRNTSSTISTFILKTAGEKSLHNCSVVYLLYTMCTIHSTAD